MFYVVIGFREKLGFVPLPSLRELNTFGDIPIARCYISVITRIELLGSANITAEDEVFLQSVLSEIKCIGIIDA